jgi:DNA-binding transcriptional MerR regulator
MTGLSADTLRAWERRYEVVSPGRNRHGRVYSDADVARLRCLAELVHRGHPIGTIAQASDAELMKRLARTRDRPAPRVGRGADARLAPLMAALDTYDLDEIERTLNQLGAALRPGDLVFRIVVPLLQEVGRRWQAGALRPSQEHLVSALVRSVLGGLLRATSRPDGPPRVVFATLSGERHELGLLCAAVLAATAGCGPIYLGPDVPAHDIIHAATTTGARVVVIGATSRGVASRREAQRLIRMLPPDVELWVGGPAAGALVSAAQHRARMVPDLDALLPMLSRYGRWTSSMA